METTSEVDGLFHCFGNNFIDFEGSPGNFTVAIVEMIDGTVRMVDVDNIRFTQTLKGGPHGRFL